ncbi:MAG: galactose-phosphate uridylyltransferase, partial [Pseudomonadota bacterium]
MNTANAFDVFDAKEHPHRRLNPLNGHSVLVSPQRSKRPWQGQAEKPERAAALAHDKSCYLCAGNSRVNGARNPDYRGPYVFGNDFAAVAQDTPAPELHASALDRLFTYAPARGEARVICFSEDHSKTLPELEVPQIKAVVDTWQDQCADLGKTYASVQVFENKGSMMGCSNPHPHGQIWATDYLPDELAAEDARQGDFYTRHGHTMLAEVVRCELGQEREVLRNQDWLVIVPFW